MKQSIALRQTERGDRTLGQFHERERLRRMEPAYSEEMRTLLRDADIRCVVKSVEAWVRAQRDYRRSSRNQGHVVEELIRQLNSNIRRSRDERAAVDAIRRARDTEMETIFKGCKVLPRSFFTKASSKDGGGNTHKGRTASKAFPFIKALNLVRPVLSDALGVEPNEGVVETIAVTVLKPTVEELAAELLPVVGTVVSGASALKKDCSGLSYEKGGSKLIDYSRKFPHNQNAVLALKAMAEIYDREAMRNYRGAAFSAANTTAGVINILSGYTASGVTMTTTIATTVAKCLDVIYQVGRDYRDKRAADKFLEECRFGPDAFAQFPLLGAYYVTEVPTSSLMPWFVQIGGVAWLDEVDHLMKHHGAQDRVKKAAKVLKKHRITWRVPTAHT